WEQQLPKPEELIPLSQTLITPDLATAFDIGTSNNLPSDYYQHQQHPQLSQHNLGEFESSELAGDEPARTLKRPRLVWTPQLHKRFVDAVAHLGIKNAVPKTIMQLMNIDGLTRENVASHLQKYRLYLKRMQGLNSGNGFGSGGDPYMPAAALQQQQQHQQMAGHHLHRHFGSTHLSRQLNQHVHVVGTPVRNSYVDDLDYATGKKALTLLNMTECERRGAEAVKSRT
ncbi:hypothetical protein M8C21_011352, partial [Ambrosia artemisiifolia]